MSNPSKESDPNDIKISIQKLSHRSTDQLGNYAEPVEIASFSYNADRKVCLDKSELKYYYAPKIGSDLNLGFPEKFTMRSNQKPEYLDALLQCLQHTNSTAQVPIQPDFCTWRGIITKFMTTPFTDDPWNLVLTRYHVCSRLLTHQKNTIYITEESIPGYGDTEQAQRFSYYGYKFETLATIDVEPHKISQEQLEKRDSEPVNTNVQYCSVFKSRFGKIQVIMGGEVDCLLKERPSEGLSDRNHRYVYAELKTNRNLTNDYQKIHFESKKQLKTWAQSYLIGIPRVIYGFRDDRGILTSISSMTVQSIWERAKSKRYWDRHVCLLFTERLLEALQKHVDVDDRKTVYTLSRYRNQITLSKLPNDCGRDFLPEWFST